MNMLENLPEYTDRVLNGLRADQTLKTRILITANQNEKQVFNLKPRRFVPVLLSSVALMIICVFLLNSKKPLPTNEEQQLIRSFSAGNNISDTASFNDFSLTDSDTVESIELHSTGKLTGREQIVKLMDLLKEHSDTVSDNEIVMTDHLDIYGSSGLLFSLPAESPYIGWSDGIRKCESFFELIRNNHD